MKFVACIGILVILGLASQTLSQTETSASRLGICETIDVAVQKGMLLAIDHCRLPEEPEKCILKCISMRLGLLDSHGLFKGDDALRVLAALYLHPRENLEQMAFTALKHCATEAQMYGHVFKPDDCKSYNVLLEVGRCLIKQGTELCHESLKEISGR